MNKLIALFTVTAMVLLVVTGCGVSRDTDRSAAIIASSVDVFAQNRLLGRGLNLGHRWERIIKDEYFTKIKDVGFDSIRFPIAPSRYSSMTEAPYTIEPEFFEFLDSAVEMCVKSGLAGVVDMHEYTTMSKRPREKKAWFLSVWKQIAERCKDYPDNIMFELLNEPYDEMTPRLWNEFVEELVPIVRETNPNRTLIIGSVCWNDINSLDNLRIPAGERNVIVTIHYYEPLKFTHQGARWVANSDEWLGTIWGSGHDRKVIYRELYRAVAWAQVNNLPLYLGEFGAVGNGDIESRVAWTSFLARQCEFNEISWAYWNFSEEPNFHVYSLKTEEWNTPILEALIPPEE